MARTEYAADVTRVLVVHSRYRSALPSGENGVVDREVDLLRSGGLQVRLHERRSDEIEAMSLPAKAALPARVVWSPAERRRCRAVIREFQPEVVHVHNTFPMLSPSVLAACSDEGVPVVMTLHNFRLTCANGMLLRDGTPCELCVGRLPLPALRHGCYRGSRAATVPVAALIAGHRVLGTHAKMVDRFLALNGFTRDLAIRSGLPAERIVVKPNFVPDPGESRKGPGHHVLYLGRLELAKGVDLLLEAWQATPMHASTLVIAGDGELRPEVESLARSRPDVRYLGQRSREECLQLLLGARALVLPSRWYENMPLTILEAFATGVGIVGPDHGAFPELIGDDQRGLCFPAGDVTELRNVLRRVISDDALVTALGVRARSQYEKHYTAERNLAALRQTYHHISLRRETSPRRATDVSAV
jgi:glycosyltransferase involved in cell wall biosynthesis